MMERLLLPGKTTFNTGTPKVRSARKSKNHRGPAEGGDEVREEGVAKGVEV